MSHNSVKKRVSYYDYYNYYTSGRIGDGGNAAGAWRHGGTG
jgi:hypothetical protein